MLKKLALISTGTGVIPSITKIARELSPQTELVNFVDDGIVRDIGRNDNVIAPAVFRRLMHLLEAAQLAGAQAALLTCSSVSEFIDCARPFAEIPIFKIDEPMIRRAVTTGHRIGVAATVATTLAPTLRQVQAVAAEERREIELQSRLAAEAFEAFQRGETERHDALVRSGLLELCASCEVVLLAQASMLSVVDTLDDAQKSRVLSSPRLGVEQVFAQFA